MPTKSITFHCEIITPMFIGNAIPGQAELRPTAIKGALRFWWRAMNGAKTLEHLREEEAKIFGSANEDDGRSKIIINIRKETSFNPIIPDFNSSKLGLSKTIKSSKGNFPSNILDYLAYGKNDWSKEEKKVLYHRQCFTPGEKFFIDLRFSNENLKNTIEEVFRIFALFGGLGSSSRNGYGQIQILDDKKIEVDQTFQKFKKGEKNPYTSFSNMAEIFFSKEQHNGWDKALSEMGWIYRESRISLEDKHNFSKRLYVAQPIIVKNENIPNFLERHSKSYFLFVNKLPTNKYQGGILCLPYNYLEECENYDKIEEAVKRMQSTHKKNYDDVLSKMNSQIKSKLL